MPFSSSALLNPRVLLAVLILVTLSLVEAFPSALPNSAVTAKPATLLGRSYTRRAADTLTLDSRRSDVPTQQLDGYALLGRAERFQIAQRRAASTPGLSRAVDDRDSVEGREILLSHQQLVPSPVSSSAPAPASPLSPAPPTTLTPAPIPIPPAPQPSATAPVSDSRVTEKSKSKTKKTKSKSKKTKGASKHGVHAPHLTIHESAE